MPPYPVEIRVSSKVVKFTLDFDYGRPGEKNIHDWLEKRNLYEPDVSWVLLRVLEAGDTVADVGGHVGYFTLFSASLVGPTGRVLTFEPNPENYERLTANIEVNEFHHVTAINRPVTADGSPMTFYTNQDNDGGHALWDPGLYPANFKSREHKVEDTVETVTLSDAFAEHGASQPPKLIKIDTEGAETMVLEGAGDLLGPEGTPFVITELNNFGLEQLGSSQHELREMMFEVGYETFLLPFSGSLPMLIPRTVDIQSSYILNLLFSSPERIAEYWSAIVIENPEHIT
jgi:FkbM family methyltransferase